MEDERGGGASVIEAAKKLGLAAVTIDAVDRSGRLPNGQLATNIPAGLDVVTQAFNSDVGVDNDPISFMAAMSGSTFSASPRRGSATSTRSRTRSRRNGARTRSPVACAPRRPRWCRSSTRAAKLADEAAAAGLKVETAASFKRDATPPGVPASAIAAAFRTAKDGAGQTPSAGNGEWIVFRVTDITVPPVDMASDDIKKMKGQLQRSLRTNRSRNTSPSSKRRSAPASTKPPSRR